MVKPKSLRNREERQTSFRDYCRQCGKRIFTGKKGEEAAAEKAWNKHRCKGGSV